MHKTVSFAILILFISVTLGFALSHGDSHFECIASQIEKANCVAISGRLGTAVHHISAFGSFTSTLISIFVLFAAAYIALNLAPSFSSLLNQRSLFTLAREARLSRFRTSARWLSLLLHSPTI